MAQTVNYADILANVVQAEGLLQPGLPPFATGRPAIFCLLLPAGKIISDSTASFFMPVWYMVRSLLKVITPKKG